MTYKGLLSRFKMLPKVLNIAYRSLVTGTYVREAKYLKYDSEFARLMDLRDLSRGLTVTIDESYTLYSSLNATSALEGAIAEVGVYKGTTAKLICALKGDKEFFLFDTFEGMPDSKITASDRWQPGTHTDTSLASVKAYLSEYSNLHFVSGIFPESAHANHHERQIPNWFSFVNLDVDLYRSTLDALEYFYPRLVIGGRLVSHNFNLKNGLGGDTPGVQEAFHEYFSGNEHEIIEIAETQCMVIK